MECPRHSSQAPRADVHRRPLPVAPNLDPRTRAVRQNFRSAGPPPCCTSSLREWTRDARRRSPSSESSSAHRLRSHSLHTSQCRSPTGCRLRWLERRRLAGLQSCRKQHSQRLRFWTPPACRTSWDSASRRARRRPGGSLYTSRGTCQRAAPPHCPVLRRPVCLHLIRQRPDKQSSLAEHSGMPSSPLCSGVKNYGGKGGAVRALVRNGAVRAGELRGHRAHRRQHRRRSAGVGGKSGTLSVSHESLPICLDRGDLRVDVFSFPSPADAEPPRGIPLRYS